VVSLIAIVPDSECRMPILIVSSAARAAADVDFVRARSSFIEIADSFSFANVLAASYK
jgi:hypothetical protein